MSRKGRARSAAKLVGIDTLDDLVTHLGIQAEPWDALIVGDGSGSGWDRGGGWAAVLIERNGARKLFYGAMNASTSQVSEIVPYLHVMSWYSHRDGPGRRRLKELAVQGRHPEVHIVTDNDVVRTCGNRQGSRLAHAGLWAVLDVYARAGYQFHFHHVRRDRVAMNILVDAVSKRARQQMENCYTQSLESLQRRYPGIPEDATVYDFLP